MDKHKKYEALPIYEQMQLPLEEDMAPAKPAPPQKPVVSAQKPAAPAQKPAAPADDSMYYEIEYDSCPLPGVGKFVLKSKKAEIPDRSETLSPSRPPEKIRPQEKDPIRDLFQQMRDIARASWASNYNSSRFYNKKIQSENSRVFYKQGMFMKDFEDDYPESDPLSSYFPNYQMMGYGQLRTYFTWRTQIRQGNIYGNSLSYAFLYLYELLNNIGVESPQDGLEQLMAFWETFRLYDKSIDRYVVKWLKDYHIYYELPHTFQEFIRQNDLREHYPGLLDPNDTFGLYCSISKYDIQKSAFYTGEHIDLVQDCFRFVMGKLTAILEEKHIILEDLIFQPVKNMTPWTPFKDALFYPGTKQPDRRVVLSEKEIYLHDKNGWRFSSVLTTESGKQFIGYILKQMESILRRETKFKYKLSANPQSVAIARELQQSGISLEAAVTGACMEFYKEATKTVVTVNPEALAKIRREAFLTQERLIVPEAEETFPAAFPSPPPVTGTKPPAKNDITAEGDISVKDGFPTENDLSAKASFLAKGNASAEGQLSLEEWMLEQNQNKPINHPNSLGFSAPMGSPKSLDSLDSIDSLDSWQGFNAALTDTERGALSILLHQPADIKPFADKHSIMLEVLIDGINEKAADFIGDSIIDTEFAIYEDYIEQVKEMVEST